MTLLAALALALVPQGPDCSNTEVGLVPLNDLGPGTYLGEEGGLYPGGVNHRPAAHDLAGRALGQSIKPLDAAGHPDPDGAIGLLAVGLSNTRQWFSGLEQHVATFGGLHPSVQLVNGAKGGVPAEQAANPNDPYWNFCLNQVAAAGLTPEQVQAFFFLTENISFVPSFPLKADLLADQMRQILTNAKALFPNARLCFATSRLYGGYSTSAHATEPVAYWNGFAVKGLIERQIAGDPLLSYTPAGGGAPGLVPWIAWGPYAWADGLEPRSDGTIWQCDQFAATDGHHLALGAQEVVGERLHEFFSTDATTATWYPAIEPPLCGPSARVVAYGTGPFGNGTPGDGDPYIASGRLPQPAHPDGYDIALLDASPAKLCGFLWGVDPLAAGGVPLFDGWLLVAAPEVVLGVTDIEGQARWSFPEVPALCGAEIVVQGAVQLTGGFVFTVTHGLRIQIGH